MEPVHIQLNADDFKVTVVNASHKALEDVTVTAKVINNDMSVAWEHTSQLSVGADCYAPVVTVPQNGTYTYNYFVKLEMRDKSGKLLSENLYWYYSQHMDFFWFSTMEKPTLNTSYEVVKDDREYEVTVRLKNESKRLSFFNRMVLTDAQGVEINPVFWSDNYVSLFPGEEKEVKARVAVSDAGGVAPKFTIVH